MKKRILLSVAYDGTGYAGYQAQKSGVPTIEGELNRALTELTGVPVEVIGASRTDAGVHARCNLAVFDTESRIPPEKFAHAINVRLPEQICVRTSLEVPEDFHPRHCSTVKTYEYRIYNAPMPDPMRRLYTWFSRYKFDVEAMREAAQYLVGEHDFKSFCSMYTSAKTTVREVLSVEVEEIPCGFTGPFSTADRAQALPDSAAAAEEEKDSAAAAEEEKDFAAAAEEEKDFVAAAGEEKDPSAAAGEEKDPSAAAEEGKDSVAAAEEEKETDAERKRREAAARMPREIVIRVSGRGFLYNMVRIIAGTLMEIGRGAKAPGDMPGILQAADRRSAGPTAPACGLTLVRYEIVEPGMEMNFD